MIVYLDTSALFKLFVRERGSTDVAALVAESEVVGTGLITRAEAAAALARATRSGKLAANRADDVRDAVLDYWESLAVVQITEAVISRAEQLAWAHSLRGYDSVQLASSITWQAALGEIVAFATYDHQLWRAARDAGVRAWPPGLVRD